MNPDLPPISASPAHAAVVEAIQQMRPNEVEAMFCRITGSHAGAIILREILYWFRPVKPGSDLPRTKIFREGRYWTARNQQHWIDLNQITRRQLNRTRLRCALFLLTQQYRYRGDRTTHFSFDFEQLLKLIDEDAKTVKTVKSRRSVRPHPSVPESTAPVPTSLYASGTDDSYIPFNPSEANKNRNQAAASPPPSEIIVGPRFARGAAAPLSPPQRSSQGEDEAASGADASEKAQVLGLEERNDHAKLQTRLSFPRALGLLRKAKGKPFQESIQALRSMRPCDAQALGYMLKWQLHYEEAHDGKSPYFNESHLQQALELSEDKVRLSHFSEVLVEAWEFTGDSKPNDPYFLCRNWSKKFGTFCKHFHTMAEELGF